MAIGLRLNPYSVQVHCVHGWSFLKRDQPNIDSSFQHFKRAYEIAPNDAFAVAGVGSFYNRLGLTQPAIKFMKRSLQLDPLSIRMIHLSGHAYISLGLYPQAKEQFQKALELDKNSQLSLFMLGLISATEGDQQGLSKQIAAIEEPSPDHAKANLKAMLLAMQGKRKEALQMGKTLDVYQILGMKSEFLAELDSISISEVNPPDPTGLREDRFYEFVRNDPRFIAILQKVQKNYDEKLARYPVPD